MAHKRLVPLFTLLLRLLLLTLILYLFYHNSMLLQRDRIRALLLSTSALFSSYPSIVYWVDFGTLLGIVRDHDIIYGETDLDVSITLESRDFIRNHNDFYDSYLRNGFHRIEERDQLKLRFHHQNGWFVDVDVWELPASITNGSVMEGREESQMIITPNDDDKHHGNDHDHDHNPRHDNGHGIHSRHGNGYGFQHQLERKTRKIKKIMKNLLNIEDTDKDTHHSNHHRHRRHHHGDNETLNDSHRDDNNNNENHHKGDGSFVQMLTGKLLPASIYRLPFTSVIPTRTIPIPEAFHAKELVLSSSPSSSFSSPSVPPPPSSSSFSSLSLHIPSHPPSVLHFWYGSTWITPLSFDKGVDVSSDELEKMLWKYAMAVYKMALSFTLWYRCVRNDWRVSPGEFGVTVMGMVGAYYAVWRSANRLVEKQRNQKGNQSKIFPLLSAGDIRSSRVHSSPSPSSLLTSISLILPTWMLSIVWIQLSMVVHFAMKGYSVLHLSASPLAFVVMVLMPITMSLVLQKER